MEDKLVEIARLEAQLSSTEKNKATEKYRGLQKARIAKLKQEADKEHKKSRKLGIKKAGDASVSVIGYEKAGKKHLVNELIGNIDKDFTSTFTNSISFRMLKYEGYNIQVLDTPRMGYKSDWIIATRMSDLVIVVLKDLESMDKVIGLLQDHGIVLNRPKPKMKIGKSKRGIEIIGITRGIDKATICKEMNRSNMRILIQEEMTTEVLLDALMMNRLYLRGFAVIRGARQREVDRYRGIKILDMDNIKEIKMMMVEELSLMRVYLKKGSTVDYDEPVVLKKGSRLEDVFKKLKHLEINFKYAKVWGDSAKYPAQSIGVDHELKDGDVVEVIKRAR